MDIEVIVDANNRALIKSGIVKWTIDELESKLIIDDSLSVFCLFRRVKIPHNIDNALYSICLICLAMIKITNEQLYSVWYYTYYKTLYNLLYLTGNHKRVVIFRYK